MKVLIIEDELPAARQLTKLLTQTDGNIKVIDVIDSVQDSVKWLNTFPTPDAVFMDIQIADGLSFDIFNHKKHIAESTLDELDTLLNPKDFFRINRKMIVRLKSIQKISQNLK